jgi:ElaB/YqjD/DUF883 family membrane-anchored ribosome-binding protein
MPATVATQTPLVMIKSVLKIVSLLIVGILVYNYFMGDDREKENARRIFGEVKTLAVSVKELLQAEKDKFDAGKYDAAVDKIGDLLEDLRDKVRAGSDDDALLDRIRDLDSQREALQRALQDYVREQDATKTDRLVPKGGKDSAEIKADLDDLVRETEQLMQELYERE